jgi:protein-tyrosine-phosphatase
MAAALLTHMLAKEGIEADIWSRGMSPTPGQPLSPGAAEALQGSGVALPDHRSRRLAEEDVLRASLILTMEERHRQLLLNAYPSAEAKTFRL